MSFIPLHIYSGYSYLISSLTIDKITKFCTDNKISTCAITDFNSFSSFVEFIDSCKERNVRPILGIDLKIKDILITFIIKNEIGYKNLLYISKLYNTNKIDFNSIKNNTEGLISIVSHKQLDLLNRFKDEDKIKFASDLNNFSNNFSEFVIGVESYTKKENDELNELKEFLLNRNYTLVAFPHFFYKKEEKLAFKIVTAIKDNINLDENTKVDDLENYLLTNEEIEEIYNKDEIENTYKITKDINFNFIKPRGTLLQYTENSDDVLKELSLKLLKEKINVTDEYLNRLNHELSIISKMKYSSYFLIVYDYVNFAKNKGIYVGPGRGSAGGSLVAYALNIITIDPVKEELLFERFLNPGRNTMPDIDSDFEDERRDEVFEYIKNKYGEDRVSHILVTQKIKAKQAIRDIGRVYKIEDSYINELSKAIEDNDTLEEAYRHSTKFKELCKQNYYLEIIKKAKLIQGLPRQPGKHPSGVIINNTQLETELPLYFEDNNSKISQIEKNDLERLSFLKMDILGIRNLTIIKNTIKLIKEKTNKEIKYEEIPYKDVSAIRLIASGNTLGLFQLESRGMNDSIKVIKPTNFDDIVSLISLYRPGPMDYIKSYGARKAGKEKITYPSNKIVSILKPTFGIIIYQEQIMQIVRVMANYTYQQADMFRRAIAKKDEKKLIDLKNDFIKKTIELGSSNKEANDVFNLIYKFANYGFNKSHAFAYAKLACIEAYLKAKYPLYFYISLLEYGNEQAPIINEIRKNKIKILGPSINNSSNKFIIKDDKIQTPISAIKGINNQYTNEILKIREIRPFKDFIDFYIRTYSLKIPDGMLTKLIESGTFDEFGTRNTFLNSLPLLKEYSNLSTVNGIIDTNLLPPPVLNNIDDNDLVNYKNETENLGFYITSPLDKYQDYIVKNKINYIENIKPGFNKILGLIIKKKIIKTKTQKDMAFILIEDNTGQKEITVFPDIFLTLKDNEINDTIIEVSGRYQPNSDKFIADKIKTL